MRRYGNILAIAENGDLISMFDFIPSEEEYIESFRLMSEALKSSKIQDVFFETFAELNSLPYEKCSKGQSVFRLGIDKNLKRYTKEEAEKFGVVKTNEIREFNHFHLNIPKQYVDNTGKSVKSILAFYRDKYTVFKRCMEEISLDTLELVKDLINQGSLLDGATHLHAVERKAKNQKIMEIIMKKKETDLESRTVEELEAMLNS